MVYLFDIIFQSGEFYGDTGFSWTEIIPEISGNLVGGFIGAGNTIWLYRAFSQKLNPCKSEF